MESKGMKIGLGALKAIIALIGVIVCLIILTRWDGDAGNIGDIIGPLNFGLYVSYFGLALSAIAMLLFGLYKFGLNIKKNIGALIGILGFVVVLLVCIYALADPTVMDNWTADPSLLTESTSRLVGGGLKSVYFLGGAAVLLIIYVEINKALK